MANNQQLRLTLRLNVGDGEDFMDTVTGSTKFADGDLDAQRAWSQAVRSRWPGVEIVMEHRLSGSASMQILGDLRCAHENLVHECPSCAQMDDLGIRNTSTL